MLNVESNFMGFLVLKPIILKRKYILAKYDKIVIFIMFYLLFVYIYFYVMLIFVKQLFDNYFLPFYV